MALKCRAYGLVLGNAASGCRVPIEMEPLAFMKTIETEDPL